MRSRAFWHEHGEKNSKDVFQFEKKNRTNKHIRKLRMSRVIKTDPFETLDAGKTFYENLYKSKWNSCCNKSSNLKTCQRRLFRMNTNKVVRERLAWSYVWQKNKKKTKTHENLRELVECSLT